MKSWYYIRHFYICSVNRTIKQQAYQYTLIIHTSIIHSEYAFYMNWMHIISQISEWKLWIIYHGKCVWIWIAVLYCTFYDQLIKLMCMCGESRSKHFTLLEIESITFKYTSGRTENVVKYVDTPAASRRILYPIQFYWYSTFNNRRCHKAALETSR